MTRSETFLSQVNDHEEPITPIASADLDYLSVNGYIMKTSKDDYGKGVDDVARLSQVMTQLHTEHDQEDQEAATLQQDTQKEHSFTFHFEGNEEKVDLRERVEGEATVVSGAESELSATGSIVNELIQEKSLIDRMVAYDGGYVSLTDLGMLVLNDLNIRNYRVADQDFPDFVTEIKATYAELRSIADTATSYLIMARPMLPQIEGEESPRNDDTDDQGGPGVQAPSLLWSVAIGLAKTQGDTNQIAERFAEALGVLQGLDSTIPNKLMAAEIMTVLSNQTIQSLGSDLSDLDKQLRGQAVPKELSAGVAATILAGRMYDGTYPLGRFTQCKGLTPSYEAASILAVMNVPFDGLSSKFATFKGMFNSWGYMVSEDTEIASSSLAIGELEADEVEEKLKYIVEQLKNYWNILWWPRQSLPRYLRSRRTRSST